MASAKIKRVILAALMESPFYFTMPLRKRLEFLNSLSQKPVYNSVHAYDEAGIREQANRAVRDLAKAE